MKDVMFLSVKGTLHQLSHSNARKHCIIYYITYYTIVRGKLHHCYYTVARSKQRGDIIVLLRMARQGEPRILFPRESVSLADNLFSINLTVRLLGEFIVS